MGFYTFCGEQSTIWPAARAIQPIGSADFTLFSLLSESRWLRLDRTVDSGRKRTGTFLLLAPLGNLLSSALSRTYELVSFPCTVCKSKSLFVGIATLQSGTFMLMREMSFIRHLLLRSATFGIVRSLSLV